MRKPSNTRRGSRPWPIHWHAQWQGNRGACCRAHLSRPVSLVVSRPQCRATAAGRIARCPSTRRNFSRTAGRRYPVISNSRHFSRRFVSPANKSTSRSRAAPVDKTSDQSPTPAGVVSLMRRLPPPNPSSANRPTSAPHSTALVNSATKATFGLTYDHAVSRRHRQPHANDAAVPSPCPIRPGAQTYAQTYATLSGIDRYRTRRSVGSTTGVTPRGSGAALRPGVIALN